jgi:hypothetical protein
MESGNFMTENSFAEIQSKSKSFHSDDIVTERSELEKLRTDVMDNRGPILA